MADRPNVSSHLKIPLEEYDSRIRTFVPFYEEMLGEMESLVDSFAAEEPKILDLGIGTGALAERCLKVRPLADLTGIDTDPDILEMARSRLEEFEKVDLRPGSFLEVPFPSVDLIVASISLHHVPEPDPKKQLFQRCRDALGRDGILILADCFLPGQKLLAKEGMESWRAHLEGFYSREEAIGFLEAWSGEDTYFPLVDELQWLGEAGFYPEVVWRKDNFAVLLCV